MSSCLGDSEIFSVFLAWYVSSRTINKAAFLLPAFTLKEYFKKSFFTSERETLLGIIA
jgi:hypothetical protein